MRRSNYRTFVQLGLAIALIAFPLFAYANIEAAPEKSPTSAPVTSANPINPAAVTTPCDTENWPNYSPDCVKGQRTLVRPRQIAIIANDLPLASLPRVIEAPLTRQHVVTTTKQEAAVKEENVTRTIKRSAPSRQTAAVRPKASPDMLPAPKEQVLAGW